MTTIKIDNATLELHPYKAAYWHEEQCLLLADLHVGKGAHFRKAGIALPDGLRDTLEAKLEWLLQHYQPKRVLFLGDLFHSDYNEDWRNFGELMQFYDTVQFELVPGNHDILQVSEYKKYGMLLRPIIFNDPPFQFSHHPMPPEESHYNLAGHLHPGVFLNGAAKQHIRLPCFHFGERQGLLPAFGDFTGLSIIKPGQQDRVFVIADEEIIAF